MPGGVLLFRARARGYLLLPTFGEVSLYFDEDGPPGHCCIKLPSVANSKARYHTQVSCRPARTGCSSWAGTLPGQFQNPTKTSMKSKPTGKKCTLSKEENRRKPARCAASTRFSGLHFFPPERKLVISASRPWKRGKAKPESPLSCC